MPGRLWIFNQYAVGPDQGASTRHYDLARELVGRGWEVTIFAAGFSHFTGREERLRGWQLHTTETIDGVEFVWLRTLPYKRNDVRRAVSMLVYSAMAIAHQFGRRRPTHVIGYTVHPLAALAALVVARRHGVPFFFEIGDLWPQTLIDLGVLRESGILARIMRRLERYLTERARAVIALMPHTSRYFQEYGIHPRQIRFVPNGVPMRIQEPASLRVPLIEAISDWRANGQFVVIYAGAHGPANGLDTVLDAAAAMKDDANVRFVLIGHGPDKARLMARRIREGLSNVEMLPPIPKRAIRSVYAAADACLVHVTRSSVHRYGNGVTFNKPLDYMAARAPVIFACDVPDDPVALARAGISISPHDPEALADAVRRLRSLSAEERAAMGDRGRQYVLEHHAMADLARTLERTLVS